MTNRKWLIFRRTQYSRKHNNRIFKRKISEERGEGEEGEELEEKKRVYGVKIRVKIEKNSR